MLVLALIFFTLPIILNLAMVVPITTNEVFLGIYLIVKGFNPHQIPDHA
jgi:uncharacterized membrane protein